MLALLARAGQDSDTGEVLFAILVIGVIIWAVSSQTKPKPKTYRRGPRRPTDPPRDPDYYQPNGDNRALRRRLIIRQNGRCAYCPKRLPLRPKKGSWHEKNWDYPTIDHVIPQSKGGSHHIDNLVAACWACNKRKGPRHLRQGGWSK